MMLIKKCGRGAAFLFSLLLFLPVAQAEQPFDFTRCGSSTQTILFATKELTVMSGDFKGITMSHLANKVFDNMTAHWIFVSKAMAGQLTSLSYTKFMDPDGDFVITETTTSGAAGETEGNFKFLEGTGKWKGIKGSGKVRAITRGKPITPGTGQGCGRYTGTFELPK